MNNVTLIDDLPTLDELETTKSQGGGIDMIPPDQANKYQKFIRNSGYAIPSQSGMNIQQRSHESYNIPAQQQAQQLDQQFIPRGTHHMHQMGQQSHYTSQYKYPMQNDIYRPYLSRENYDDENNDDENYTPTPTSIQRTKINITGEHNCIQVAEHVGSCIVCSKLYSNNNTFCYMVIGFLLLVILILVKNIPILKQ